MRQITRLAILGFILLTWVSVTQAQSPNTAGVGITSLQPGEAIRGIVPITGTTATDGFLSWELTFTYSGDPTGTWFLIAEGEQPLEEDLLAQWDTTTIIDGLYDLRLTVYRENGRRTHHIIPQLRIRNYTPIETNTPTPSLTPTPFTLTPMPSQTPTSTTPPTSTPIPVTPTPLPTNPLELSPRDVTYSLARGAAGAFAAFLLVGIYTSIRKARHR